MTQPDMQAVLALRRRYRAYLEEVTQVSFARRYGIAVSVACLGLFFLIAARFSPEDSVGGIAAGVALLIFAAALAKKSAPRPDPRLNLAQSGAPVWSVLVQANHNLFVPGVGSHFCLVLFSFEPAGSHLDYMHRLARSVGELKETQQTDLDLRYVANLTTDERAYKYRRRRLPVSFTGGPTVYCADLILVRSCLPNGFLTERVLPCIAETGEQGALELLPWWMAAGQDSKPN